MIITKNFPGGNIKVISQAPDHVVVEREMRDSEGDWFYWAFCVEDVCHQNEPDKTVLFSFPKEHRVGKFGAAVSHDLINWRWSYSKVDSGFTYSFKPGEKVYFAFCFIYSEKRLRSFAEQSGIELKTFCKSNKGREVPYFEIGTGDKVVIFTSRHHACESSGTFVMEGIAQQCLKNTLKGYKFVFIPFLDYDGVTDGDQGKSRLPHDANRDYVENGESIYSEVRELRKYADNCNIWAAFDLHSPWMEGNEHDAAYFLKCPSTPELVDFLTLLKHLTCSDKNSFSYDGNYDFEYGAPWNEKGRPDMKCYFIPRAKSGVSLTMETSYSGTSDNPFLTERVIRLGEHFYDALSRTILI